MTTELLCMEECDDLASAQVHFTFCLQKQKHLQLLLLGEPSSAEYTSLFELFHAHYLPHITLIGAGKSTGSANAFLGATLNVDGKVYSYSVFYQKLLDSYIMDNNATIKALAKERAGQVSECAKSLGLNLICRHARYLCATERYRLDSNQAQMQSN